VVLIPTLPVLSSTWTALLLVPATLAVPAAAL
jgi:hypothetical protein